MRFEKLALLTGLPILDEMYELIVSYRAWIIFMFNSVIGNSAVQNFLGFILEIRFIIHSIRNTKDSYRLIGISSLRIQSYSA